MVVLETDRLLLRRFTESDVDSLVELDGDPMVMRFLTGGKPTPREVVRDELLPRLLADYDRVPGCGRFAAIEKATGQFIGWFALDPPTGHGDSDSDSDGDTADTADTGPELGYRLRTCAWGKGFATEGSRALIDKAFADHDITRIWAQTMAVNLPSRRVMERLGMRHVRTFHLTWDDPIDGAEHGEVEYELRKAEWADRYPPRVTTRGPVLILVGPPGSGKTTIGQALAQALDVEFRDTDTDVETAAGKTISDIFTDDGESAFRAREEHAVRTAVAEHTGVLALGGGAVLSQPTRVLLADRPVVFLNVSMAEGVRRTGLSQARPLLAGVNPRAKFKELLDARLPLYREVAALEVTTDERSPDQIVSEVLNTLHPQALREG